MPNSNNHHSNNQTNVNNTNNTLMQTINNFNNNTNCNNNSNVLKYNEPANNLKINQVLNTKNTFAKKKTLKQLKMLHYNCNSYAGKSDQIERMIKREKPDIISLNEIKCSEHLANCMFNIDGYLPYFKCRTDHGGGVCLLISETLEVVEEISLPFEAEIIGVKIKLKNKTFNVFSYYNAPDNGSTMNKNVITYIYKTFKDNIILGDLNAKMPKFNNKRNRNGQILESIIAESNLTILNNKMSPTNFRYTLDKQSHAVLDYAIGSKMFADSLIEYSTLRKSEMNVYEKSYFHVPIRLIFKLQRDVKITRTSKNDSYIYDRADWTKFGNELDSLMINIDNESNLNDLNSKISASIITAADKSIPKVTKTGSHPIKYPLHIVNLFKLVKFWQRQHDKRKSETTRQNLYSLKDQLSDELIKFKSHQWQRFLEKLGPHILSTIPFWRRINRFRGKKTSKTIGTLKVNDTLIKTDEEKATVFSNKLFNTFNEDINPRFCVAKKNTVNEYFDNNSIENDYTNKQATLFSPRDLKRALARINNKTSVDLFGVSNKILKHVSDKCKEKVLLLFNNCLIGRDVPDAWRMSIVKMLPKKSIGLNNPANYRPISITASLARLFERLVLARLHMHLRTNGIIIDQQSGFRTKRSTKDNLTFLAQKAQESINASKNMICIFFDIAAAFDKVWHRGLIYKLIKINTPYYLVKIIEAFLKDRLFSVKVGDFTTERQRISCGVPQGAVLSPTLFSIYINDAPIEMEKDKKFSLVFADDLCHCVMYDVKTIEVERNIQNYLDCLEKWANEWRLSLAPHKCQYIVFTNKHVADEFNLTIYGQKVTKDEHPKFLGVTFDRKLNYNSQIDIIVAKCNGRIGLIKTLAHRFWSLDKSTLMNIYKSLIRSLIDYSALMVSKISKGNMAKLQVVQNNVLRTIYRKFWHGVGTEFSTEKLHQLARIESIEDRLNKLNNRYMEEALNNKNPIITTLKAEYLTKCAKIQKKTFLHGQLSCSAQLSTISSH